MKDETCSLYIPLKKNFFYPVTPCGNRPPGCFQIYPAPFIHKEKKGGLLYCPLIL